MKIALKIATGGGGCWSTGGGRWRARLDWKLCEMNAVAVIFNWRDASYSGLETMSPSWASVRFRDVLLAKDICFVIVMVNTRHHIEQPFGGCRRLSPHERTLALLRT